MKVKVISDGAGWVLDAIANDYRKFTRLEIDENRPITWVVNYWSLASIENRSRVVAHVHHINQDKIDRYDFGMIDSCLACIVNNDLTYEMVTGRVKCPVKKLPYWVLSGQMQESKRRDIAGDLLIGSFQKDGENKTGKPKIIKGPDMLIDVMVKLKSHGAKAILAGYNREYVIKELRRNDIPFEFFEKDGDLAGLYDALDWYFVTSRCEGGPQAVLEASYRKVKILSTRVGIASEVLHADCLCDTANDFVEKCIGNIDRTKENYAKVMKEFVPSVVIPQYDNFFKSL